MEEVNKVASDIRESKDNVKVNYERDLWDYEMKSQQNCRRIKQRIDLSAVKPKIDYNNWEIKKAGGFFFGFGAKD